MFQGVSDHLWSLVEPLIPVAERSSDRVYQRQPGGGRKPMQPRQIFSAIVYVLRSGCTWNALPRRFGSASTVHRHFLRWSREGFFSALWHAGLAEHAELEGIRWCWQRCSNEAEIDSNCIGNKSNDSSRKWEVGKLEGLLVSRAWQPSISRRKRD